MRFIWVLTASIRWGVTQWPGGDSGDPALVSIIRKTERLGWECSHNIQYKQNQNQKSQDR